MAEQQERCETCRWWDQDENESTAGSCCRYPPSIIPFILKQDDFVFPWGTFPMVTYHHFCGEWSPSNPQSDVSQLSDGKRAMSELLSMARMARRLGVTQQWLRQQADAGKVPCLKAGNRYLFNAEAVQDAVATRASSEP